MNSHLKPTLRRQQAEQRWTYPIPKPASPAKLDMYAQSSNWNPKVSVPEMTSQYSSGFVETKMKPNLPNVKKKWNFKTSKNF